MPSKQKNADFKRRKQKVGKKKLVQANQTDTRFRYRAIRVPHQAALVLAEASESDDVASQRQLLFRKYYGQMKNHAAGSRKDAMLALRDMLTRSSTLVALHAADLVGAAAERFLDVEAPVREAASMLWEAMAARLPERAFRPLFPLLMVFLRSAFTSVHADVRLDTLTAVLTLTAHYPDVVEENQGALVQPLADYLAAERSSAIVVRSALVHHPHFPGDLNVGEPPAPTKRTASVAREDTSSPYGLIRGRFPSLDRRLAAVATLVRVLRIRPATMPGLGEMSREAKEGEEERRRGSSRKLRPICADFPTSWLERAPPSPGFMSQASRDHDKKDKDGTSVAAVRGGKHRLLAAQDSSATLDSSLSAKDPLPTSWVTRVGAELLTVWEEVAGAGGFGEGVVALHTSTRLAWLAELWRRLADRIAETSADGQRAAEVCNALLHVFPVGDGEKETDENAASDQETSAPPPLKRRRVRGRSRDAAGRDETESAHQQLNFELLRCALLRMPTGMAVNEPTGGTATPPPPPSVALPAFAMSAQESTRHRKQSGTQPKYPAWLPRVASFVHTTLSDAANGATAASVVPRDQAAIRTLLSAVERLSQWSLLPDDEPWHALLARLVQNAPPTSPWLEASVRALARFAKVESLRVPGAEDVSLPHDWLSRIPRLLWSVGSRSESVARILLRTASVVTRRASAPAHQSVYSNLVQEWLKQWPAVFLACRKGDRPTVVYGPFRDWPESLQLDFLSILWGVTGVEPPRPLRRALAVTAGQSTVPASVRTRILFHQPAALDTGTVPDTGGDQGWEESLGLSGHEGQRAIGWALAEASGAGKRSETGPPSPPSSTTRWTLAEARRMGFLLSSGIGFPVDLHETTRGISFKVDREDPLAAALSQDAPSEAPDMLGWTGSHSFDERVALWVRILRTSTSVPPRKTGGLLVLSCLEHLPVPGDLPTLWGSPPPAEVAVTALGIVSVALAWESRWSGRASSPEPAEAWWWQWYAVGLALESALPERNDLTQAFHATVSARLGESDASARMRALGLVARALSREPVMESVSTANALRRVWAWVSRSLRSVEDRPLWWTDEPARTTLREAIQCVSPRKSEVEGLADIARAVSVAAQEIGIHLD